MNFNFLDAFFGNISETSKRFIDDFGNRKKDFVHDIYGQKKPIWINTDKPFELYCEIPELRAVINRKAQMISHAKPCLINEDGEIIESHWVYDLIANPNPTQSWNDVIFSLAVNDNLFSSAFAYAPKRSFGIVNLFVPLPSNQVQINLSGANFKQMDSKGLIDNITFLYSKDNKTNIEVDELVIIQTADGINLINPVSRIESLKYPLSNIRAQYSKRNVLLENLGAVGILSAEKSDIGGALPLDAEEKQQIQKDWYNRSKDEIIITEQNVRWNPMSYPTKDLMLFEELTADKLALVDAFGLNQYIFSQEKGATFSNVKDGIKMAYNDTIIPEAKKIYNNITEQIGLEKEGLRLVPKFNHLPVLQKDKLESSQALNSRADALNKIIQAGVVLTDEEKRALLNIEE